MKARYLELRRKDGPPDSNIWKRLFKEVFPVLNSGARLLGAFGLYPRPPAHLPMLLKPSIIKIEDLPEDDRMRGYLINKNLCFYYRLRKRIGKKRAFYVAKHLETLVLLFGREPVRQPSLAKDPGSNHPISKRNHPCGN